MYEKTGKQVVILIDEYDKPILDAIYTEYEEQNRQELNAILPAYSKLAAIRLHEEEFEKTPKKSIKRYLYVE